MNYATQMEAARKRFSHGTDDSGGGKGSIFPGRSCYRLMAEGRIIIPCNKEHKSVVPNGLGSMLKTKINVNLGTSRDMTDLEME